MLRQSMHLLRNTPLRNDLLGAILGSSAVQLEKHVTGQEFWGAIVGCHLLLLGRNKLLS